MKRQFENIRTGVIGVGSMGKNHARIYNEISNLVAVSDNDERNGLKIANKYGVKWFKDYEKMFQYVDAVSIATPTIYHRAVADSAINNGVHILVEKPLSDNIVDAEFIVRKAEKNNVNVSVGHIERFNPVTTFCKKALSSGEWGDLIFMSSKRFSPRPTRIKDVGVIFDIGIHDLDLMRFLSGDEVTNLHSAGGFIGDDMHHSFSTILLQFSSGLKASCEVSWLKPNRLRELSVTCSKYYAVLDFAEQTINLYDMKLISNGSISADSPAFSARNKVDISKKEPLLLEIQDFLSSISKNSQPLVGGIDGLESVKLAKLVVDSLNNV